MATIKAIEGRSVHQIQSGQVIVDLCSVVKELVENSLDAGATSIEVRFKGQGLDSVEILDNGKGIAPEDFETVALKHYTSKLSSFDDIQDLNTFGFRGEALSSLCALSKFHIRTARAEDGALGKKLDFEISGRLKSITPSAAPKGTSVCIEDLFYNLPVRRKELVKNIKREYAKVLALLHSYACISVGVRFAVANQMAKGPKNAVFSTRINTNTRDNIVNVFGAKAASALASLDLQLEMEPSTGTSQIIRSQSLKSVAGDRSLQVHVQGHISKPIFGEGRQAPDRQMFFVNSRPCLLPQVSKAINEVYKSFNVSQSPFIFANLVMDTKSYDVNVSPDKRTILLHDQTALLESLKTALTEMFGATDQTVPLADVQTQKSALNLLSNARTQSRASEEVSPSLGADESNADMDHDTRTTEDQDSQNRPGRSRLGGFLALQSDRQPNSSDFTVSSDGPAALSDDSVMASGKQSHKEVSKRVPFMDDVIGESAGEAASHLSQPEQSNIGSHTDGDDVTTHTSSISSPLFCDQEDRVEPPILSITSNTLKSKPGVVQNAFDRMRARRTPLEIAEITVGDSTTTRVVGNGGSPYKRRRIERTHTPHVEKPHSSRSRLANGLLQHFAAPGSQLETRNYETSPVQSQDSDEVSNDGSQSPGSLQQAEEEERNDETHSAASSNEANSVAADDTDMTYDNAENSETIPNDDAPPLTESLEEKPGRFSAEEILRRASRLLRNGNNRKDSPLRLETRINAQLADISRQSLRLDGLLNAISQDDQTDEHSVVADIENAEAESRLSLTVSKPDFGRMQIVGQFNLGFILATRLAADETTKEDLFIIDQHAADEKYNYERLQRTVSLQSQRLVIPKPLELSALEEEIISNNPGALKANGFEIERIPPTPVADVDDEDVSFTAPQSRYNLLTLPMSREKTFDLSDLEELIHLIIEAPAGSQDIPRPKKVQTMLAMRACRSSIMVGRTLTLNQMSQVVTHMGEMDKPWNCPHGRPTMRHLAGLAYWKGWTEGDPLRHRNDFDDENIDNEAVMTSSLSRNTTDWTTWLQEANG